MTDVLDWVTGVGQVGAVVFAAWAAKSAAGSADAARDALREQSRPFVVPGTTAPELDVPGRTFSLPMRNVGRGAARLLGYRIRILGEKDYDFRAEIYGTHAIPADAEVQLEGDLVPPDLHARLAQVAPDARRGIAVWLDYADYAGRQCQWTVFRLVVENAAGQPKVQSARYGEYTAGVDPAVWNQPPVPDR